MAQAIFPSMKPWPRPLKFISNSSWLYPFKGIYYFIAHPFLYPLLRSRLIPCLLLSIFVLVNLFVWTYLPQVAFLAIFHGPLAWVQAAILVLGEGAAIISLLFEGFFVDETLVDVFDAVLINEGLADLVAQRRFIHTEGHNPVQRLGKPMGSAVYAPFSIRQMLEFVVFLPISLIPVVGIPVFLILTGYRAGPLHHHRYYQLLDLTSKDKQAMISKRKWKYTWFGTMALSLQLVPALSMFFLLTTAAGSAMWVVKLEQVRRQGIEEAERIPEEEYRDEP